jgi:hypothetical protein
MKKLMVIGFFMNVASLVYSQTPINFTEAWQKKQIEASFKGNDKSVHYIKPLVITIKNLQKTALHILLESGTYFASEPLDYQDITITEDLIVKLQPNQSQTLEVYGVCTEAGNAAPGATVSYAPSPAPKPEFAILAKYLAQEKLYGTSEAQHAMWVLSNNHDWKNIYASTDEKGEIARKIRNQIAKIKGIELKLTPEGELILSEKTYQVIKNGQVYTQYTYQVTETQTSRCEMSGGADYRIAQPAKMRLAMFDEKNVLVREIYFNEKEKAGTHAIKYAYDCDKYPNSVYHFKLIKNDHIYFVSTLRKTKKG